ncbi:hypothetical protein GMST_13140 [Geomonas silvestris]|uniref:Conjugal transfer protein TraF n=1 Tax=Geomonas silvestris TaxID=2740184 RepID=A0A6V8MH20_9BACT|nr:conjugal transfer protein TraF [Geomonas silvestris]GFO58989.1 hypothetical protein GMST_13140 [Geomonas silvestris]
MIRRSAAVAAILLGIGSTAHALEFQPVGAGSLGVGGAGVARTYGAMAPYWNPAGLAFAPKTATVSLTAGVGLNTRGKLAEDLDNLVKANDAWTGAQNQGTADGLATAFDALVATNEKDNLHVTGQAAFGAQIKHFGFGAYGTFEGGANPDPGGLTIPVPVTLNGTATNQFDTQLGSKTVSLRGIALIEAPVSYGYAFNAGKFGKVGVGASVKYMNGMVTNKEQTPIYAAGKVTSSSDLAKDVRKNVHDSSSVGFDLGTLWKPVPSFAVGLVGKNLNSPSFKAKNGEKITVGRQVRAGVSWEALSWLELTGDVDVFSNSTIIPGMKSQNLGGGAEFHPFSCLKLRAGGYTNLADSASDGAVTAGLSVGIPWFFLDIDGAYGLGSAKFDNHSYPSEAKAQVSLNFAF